MDLSRPSRIEVMDVEAEGQLRWGTNTSQGLIKGSSDYSLISHLKDSILSLRQEYFSTSSSHPSFFAENRDGLDRRLLLIERELDGLLRRDIIYSNKSVHGGRGLDYTNILN